MALIESYFDESGSHDGSPALGVAGFAFTKAGAAKLDQEWGSVLERYELPFFHMVDCAHGNPPFDRLTRDERIAVEKEMIALIRDNLLCGYGVSISEREYNEFFPDHVPYGSAYSLCCWTCLEVVQHWIEANGIEGDAAYFFEAGHASQSEANRIMTRILSHEQLRRDYRYSSHAFADKKKLRPLQAADLLAWLQANQAQRFLRKEPTMRKDLAALMDGKPIEGRFIGREQLRVMKEQTRIAMRDPNALITGKYGSFPFVADTLRD
ncbi:MAG: DUF3800 domain-containing protein [Xanthobacteraceae bacterium]